MKIKIEGTINGNFRADLEDLPGSPPIGFGKTKEQAVANLFFSILHPTTTEDWIKYINFETFGSEIS